MTTWKESNVLQAFTTSNSTEIIEPFQHNHEENEWFPKKDNNRATMKIINLAREKILGSSKAHWNYSSGLIISIIRNQMDNLYLLSVFGAWVFIYIFCIDEYCLSFRNINFYSKYKKSSNTCYVTFFV